jgi:hypothetical protein
MVMTPAVIGRSCLVPRSKNTDKIFDGNKSNVFIRIAQIDKNGIRYLSKIINEQQLRFRK